MANNAPYWSNGWASVTRGGGKAASIQVETVTSWDVSWGGAIDPDGNTLWYDVYRVTSNHGNKLIYHGTNTNCTDSTFSTDSDVYVEMGQNVYYNVSVQDEFGLWASSVIRSQTITRNDLIPASLTFDYNHTIGFSTTEFICSRSDPHDLFPTYFFFYNLTCDKVVVYNPTVDIRQTGDPSSIIIWRTGDPVPTTPYVIFNELAVALRDTYYNGVLTFTLSTRNEFDTIKTKTASIEVDLRTEPLWTTPNFQYTGGYTINNHLYYLPDVRAVTLSWNAAIERLEGGTVSYDVEYKLLTDTEWKRIGWEITSTSINVNIPSTDLKTMYNVRVVAKVSYDRSTIGTVENISIDKYLRPIVGLKSKKRNATSVVVNLNITPRTTILSSDYSIASLNFLKCNNITYVDLPTSSWTPTFEYGVTPYADATFTKTTSYTMICRFNDSLGAVFGGSYANVLTLSIPITAYTPMLSIRKKGIGINDINDGTGSFILKVKGKVNSIIDNNNESGYYENGQKLTCASILYHAPNGLLINVAPIINNRMFIVTVKGNSYLGNQPYDSIFQVYHNISTDSQPFISAYQVDSGMAISGAKWINDGTNIYLWFPQPSGYSTFVVECFRQDIGFIKAVSVTNAVKPSGKELASVIVTNYITAPNALANDISSTNLNTLFKTGFYRGLTVTNAPDAGWWYFTITAHDSSNWALQEATAFGSGNGVPAGTKYHRVCVAGTWGSWLAG